MGNSHRHHQQHHYPQPNAYGAPQTVTDTLQLLHMLTLNKNHVAKAQDAAFHWLFVWACVVVAVWAIVWMTVSVVEHTILM